MRLAIEEWMIRKKIHLKHQRIHAFWVYMTCPGGSIFKNSWAYINRLMKREMTWEDWGL